MTWDYRGNRCRGKAIENIEGVCKHGDWVYGAYVEGARLDKIPYIIGNIEEATDDYVIPYFWARVDKETVGQGLGKADIKGNEIFEGDIVCCWIQDNYNRSQALGVVQYNIHNSEYYLYILKCEGAVWYPEYVPLATCCEIEGIGNIHDNPELLEVD